VRVRCRLSSRSTKFIQTRSSHVLALCLTAPAPRLVVHFDIRNIQHVLSLKGDCFEKIILQISCSKAFTLRVRNAKIDCFPFFQEQNPTFMRVTWPASRFRLIEHSTAFECILHEDAGILFSLFPRLKPRCSHWNIEP